MITKFGLINLRLLFPFFFCIGSAVAFPVLITKYSHISDQSILDYVNFYSLTTLKDGELEWEAKAGKYIRESQKDDLFLTNLPVDLNTIFSVHELESNVSKHLQNLCKSTLNSPFSDDLFLSFSKWCLPNLESEVKKLLWFEKQYGDCRLVFDGSKRSWDLDLELINSLDLDNNVGLKNLCISNKRSLVGVTL